MIRSLVNSYLPANTSEDSEEACNLSGQRHVIGTVLLSGIARKRTHDPRYPRNPRSKIRSDVTADFADYADKSQVQQAQSISVKYIPKRINFMTYKNQYHLTWRCPAMVLMHIQLYAGNNSPGLTLDQDRFGRVLSRILLRQARTTVPEGTRRRLSKDSSQR
jgi:hypothetical protein